MTLKSTHRVEVVRVFPEPHPNADMLEIIKVWEYICCVRKGEFAPGDLAAYIPPDSVVPVTEQFAFLGEHRRIRVKRLRGIISMGLLIPAPIGVQEGDDIAGMLGVTHYEPSLSLSSGGEAEKPPSGFRPVFDMDSFYRYAHIFEEGELVYVTEKIHGCSARYAWHDGRMYCGSRTEWKKQDEKNLWWRALANHPEIAGFCKSYPENMTLYGEVYGQVQNLKYGTMPGEVRFAAFDLLHGNEWINALDARRIGDGLPWVPIVDCGPFDKTRLIELADGPSLIEGADHIREGIVVKPVQERTHPEVGRVCLKIVSSLYLER